MAEQIEQIITLKAEGKSSTEIGAELGITKQKVTALYKQYEMSLPTEASDEPVTLVEPDENGCLVFKAEQYMEHSKANGRTAFGGKKGKRVPATIEELRALINSNWTPALCMEKWQMSEEELQQLVWKLSKAELRDVPVKVNFKHNYFR